MNFYCCKGTTFWADIQINTLAYAVMRVCGGLPRKNPDAPTYEIAMQLAEWLVPPPREEC